MGFSPVIGIRKYSQFRRSLSTRHLFTELIISFAILKIRLPDGRELAMTSTFVVLRCPIFVILPKI